MERGVGDKAQRLSSRRRSALSVFCCLLMSEGGTIEVGIDSHLGVSCWRVFEDRGSVPACPCSDLVPKAALPTGASFVRLASNADRASWASRQTVAHSCSSPSCSPIEESSQETTNNGAGLHFQLRADEAHGLSALCAARTWFRGAAIDLLSATALSIW